MGLLEMLKGEQPGPIKTLLNYENAGQFGEFAMVFSITHCCVNFIRASCYSI